MSAQSAEERLRICTAKGYRTDAAAQTVSGVEGGVAFRMDLNTMALEMSVNVPPARYAKLQGRLAAANGRYAEVAVAPYRFGILLTLPEGTELGGEELTEWIAVASREAAALIGTTYTDRFEKKQSEPATAYVTGALGALLGAVVGVLPWFIAAHFLNFQFGWLAFLVSTGAFFGYCQLRGAHHTTFAMTMIVLFSLLAMIGCNVADLSLTWVAANPELTVWQAVQLCFTSEGLKALGQNMLFGVVFAALGLFTMRSRVLAYTHEPWFLRRR